MTVPLPAEHRACLACGVAVPNAQPGAVPVFAEAAGRAGEPVRPRPVAVSFTRCRSCRATLDRAARITSSHPRLAAWFGSVLEGRVDAALTAVAALGRSEHRDDEQSVLDLLELAGVGGRARWMRRYVPVMAPDAEIDTCAPYPWAHLTPADHIGLNAAYAQLLRARVTRHRPPVRLPPPPVGSLGTDDPVPGGCLMCGVGAVAVSSTEVHRLGGPESAAVRVWTACRIDPLALGGRRSPRELSGHLCPDCEEARRSVGSIGPSAMERAVTGALDPESSGLLPYGGEVVGLVGWATLGLPPSAKPWAHFQSPVASR